MDLLQAIEGPVQTVADRCYLCGAPSLKLARVNAAYGRRPVVWCTAPGCHFSVGPLVGTAEHARRERELQASSSRSPPGPRGTPRGA